MGWREMGASARELVSAVSAVSAPLDLAAGGYAIGRGFNRLVYTRMFLNTMRPKALRKLEQHPGLFDWDALMQARDLYTFDNIFTAAPVHGFLDTADYWEWASAKPHPPSVAVPALLVNARNDPFVPATSLPLPGQAVHMSRCGNRPMADMSVFPLAAYLACVPCRDAAGQWLPAHAR